nr:hypothetical protein [Akkermansiaceae bacterium]
MNPLTSFLRLLPILAFPVAATATLVETPAEIQLTADLDGDGRHDLVVIDRAGGGFRAAYQLAPGVWTWSAARATGIADIHGAAAGTWFLTDREALAVVSPSSNRVHIVR